MKTINCLVVCGPTASGKTTLAVSLAKKCRGEIISADSRQVYRGMDIGTGKDLFEYNDSRCRVPYHCIDIVDPATIYTLFHFQKDFSRAHESITQRGNRTILSGGTGLYIEAVLKGYAIPEIPEDCALRKELQARDKDDLAQELMMLDSAIYEKTDLSSKKRVIRAIEVATHSQKKSTESVPQAQPQIRPLVLCTRWPRPVLHERIDKRLYQRIDGGLIDEAKRILDSGIDRARYDLFGLEYKFAARYLDGEIDKDTMISQLKTAIHQFAKRQETWFRGMERRGTPVHWVDNASLDNALQIIGRCAPEIL